MITSEFPVIYTTGDLLEFMKLFPVNSRILISDQPTPVTSEFTSIVTVKDVDGVLIGYFSLGEQ